MGSGKARRRATRSDEDRPDQVTAKEIADLALVAAAAAREEDWLIEKGPRFMDLAESVLVEAVLDLRPAPMLRAAWKDRQAQEFIGHKPDDDSLLGLALDAVGAGLLWESLSGLEDPPGPSEPSIGLAERLAADRHALEVIEGLYDSEEAGSVSAEIARHVRAREILLVHRGTRARWLRLAKPGSNGGRGPWGRPGRFRAFLESDGGAALRDRLSPKDLAALIVGTRIGSRKWKSPPCPRLVDAMISETRGGCDVEKAIASLTSLLNNADRADRKTSQMTQ